MYRLLLSAALLSWIFNHVYSFPTSDQIVPLVATVHRMTSSIPHPLGYVALKTDRPLSLNGKLSDPEWQAAAWSEEFQDILGPTGVKPWHSTKVKMLWDDTYLYIGAYLEEPYPWADLALHDSIVYHDNDFEVFIDPDGDNWMYYELEINARGTLWDLFLIKPYRDDGVALHSFETIAPSEPTQADGPTGWLPLKRAVHVDGHLNDGSKPSQGWSVELAIPWSILAQAAHRPSPPKPGHQWRINFSRVQWNVSWDQQQAKYVKIPADQKENNWVWSPQYEVAMHKPELWGYVQFSDQLVLRTADGGASSSGSGSGGGGDVAGGPGSQGLLPPPPFQPDPSWPLRCFLMEVYYRQKSHYSRHGSYSPTLEELGLEAPPAEVASRVGVQTTEVSFIATGQIQLPDDAAAAAAAGLPAGGGSSAPSPMMFRRFYVNEQSRITWRDVSGGASSS